MILTIKQSALFSSHVSSPPSKFMNNDGICMNYIKPNTSSCLVIILHRLKRAGNIFDGEYYRQSRYLGAPKIDFG